MWFSIVKDRFKVKKEAVMVVFALWLDLQLPVESVPITYTVVSSNPAQAKCTRYNITQIHDTCSKQIHMYNCIS
jgi:hypothetical protein